MRETFLAKYNRVWQNVKTGTIAGEKLELKDGENLRDYKQIPKPKKDGAIASQEKSTKQKGRASGQAVAVENEGGTEQ